MRGYNGIKEINYGEYPQTIVNLNLSNTLEGAFSNGTLRKTGKTYTTDSVNYNEYSTGFSPRTHIEYEYNGKKYIRFIGDFNGSGETLSDGRNIENGTAYWVEVEPITWLVDENANIALSKKLIFAGVQFNKERNYTGNFDQTDIKKFLDVHFSKDITARIVYSQNTNLSSNNNFNISTTDEKIMRKKNPHGFIFDVVSEEDLIKGLIESDLAPFLHGRSSEGKSARVKQYDPDCEIVYLRNATPESLNGKSVYNSETGEMIDVPPTWYKKLKQKCEAEPDKLHIVFFDEITNALPSIQGMAFNIVLDKEVNGIWKLPENARVVAAGNDLNDSLAANAIAEPLFNRFGHVYINTTVESWLKWASTPKEKYEKLDYKKNESQAKIHPAIYSYIAYKASRGEEVLRSPYNGEKPNADPRKWEMSSKVLNVTKNPEMLRALVGEEITRDFVAFCMQQVITVEDVLNGNYTEEYFNINISEKFATAVGLSSVDEKNVELIRNFVAKLGAEILATFETLWIHGDEQRLEIIAELKMKDGGLKI